MSLSLLDRLYDRSPILVQNAMVSSRGALFRLRRSNDNAIRAHLERLLASQWWSAEQFHNYQIARLQELLAVAFNHVPYYRDLSRSLGCTVADFKSVADIRRLPTLSKQRVRGNERDFIRDGLDLNKCYRASTSGTTGTPITIYETRRSMSHRLAFVARLRKEAGLTRVLHPRRAQWTGRRIVPAGQSRAVRKYWRHNVADHALLLSADAILSSTATAYVAALERFQPELMDGYPSSMRALARCYGNRVRLPSLKAIITSAETLTHEDRTELEAAYGVPVFDQYAATEPSCFWSDCRSGNMHINQEYGISEILAADGREVQVGEEGRVVVTSFLNHGMVLLRYQIGDTAVRGSDAKCECGREMPRVGSIGGRIEDELFFTGRGWTKRLDTALKGLDNILECQMIHEAPMALRVLIVKAPGYEESTAASLAENLHRIVGHDVAINISYVDSIPRGPNGKFQAVRTLIRNTYPARTSADA